MNAALQPSQPRQVEWVRRAFGSEVRWTKDSEPSIAAIEQLARDHLQLNHGHHASNLSVEFLAQGDFNKLYTVHADQSETDSEWVIRVALPVEPRRKTLSEVATLSFVRNYCTDLVPRVYAYNADADPANNALGFEWIIMEKMPGRVLADNWDDMTWDAKEELVRDIVAVIAKTFACRFSLIGNIYPDTYLQADSDRTSSFPVSVTPAIGRVVSMEFFWENNYDYDVPRGPFRSIYDWLSARLSLAVAGAEDTLTHSSDKEEREEAEETIAIAQRLLDLLPSYFSPTEDLSQLAMLFHDDFNSHNILVDDHGKLTGIVDWECVSVVPLWKACQLPRFLVQRDREVRPDVSTYFVEEDGRPTGLYFEHVVEWEKTCLRHLFLKEMEKVAPEWVEIHRASETQRRVDFELAVSCCSDDISRLLLKRWLDYIEKGDESSKYMSLLAELSF